MPAQLDTTYETLVKGFLEAMNEIGRYGKEKYGDQSFERQVASGLPPSRDVVRTKTVEIMRHAKAHIGMYMNFDRHDHFGTYKHQLAAAAFNLMMEYYYEDFDKEEVLNELPRP